MYEVINFDKWHKYDGAPIGSGRGKKEWLESDEKEIGLFKYPKIFSDGSICGEHWAEKIACEIAKVIGIPCANVDLGTYHGNVGSISYLMIDLENETMVEGEQYIRGKYPSYNVDKMMDDVTLKKYTVSLIEEVLDDESLFEQFLKILIFDCLIGNSDRHQNNWGIIRGENEEPLRIAPVYDNGSSLCCRVAASDVDSYFKDSKRFNALVDTKSRSMVGIDDKNKRPRYTQVLEYLRDHYYNETKPLIGRIESDLTEEVIEDIVENIPACIMKPEQKRLVRHFIKCKKDKMLDLYK